MINSKKIILGTITLAVAVSIFLGVRYFIKLENYKKIISGIIIKQVDLSKVADGTYEGSFDAIMIEAKTRVTVKNHKITNITLLEHKNERGQAASVIPSKVVSAQSLKVDTVSGATNSSKVILMSIENALKKGEKNIEG